MSQNAAKLAVRLPWLAPSVPALAAIARGAPCDDLAILGDPAAVALVLRFSSSFDEFTSARRAKLLRFVRRRLRAKPVGLVRLDARPLGHSAKAKAPRNLQDQAYIVGLMSQLGRLALDSVGSTDNTDANKVTRRLARRWGFPAWCLRHLDLLDQPADVCDAMGGDSRILNAVRSAERQTGPLALLEVSDPYSEELLVELLAMSEKNHRRASVHRARSLEREIDRLYAAFRDHVAQEDSRLRDRKLTALAEFAAGAGHEFNTPLAIISGQSQYLLSWEEDPERRKTLQTIVQQTHRVHELLTDLIQFARPAAPQIQVVELNMLARVVIDLMAARAQAKDVRLAVEMPEEILAHADPRQYKMVLNCLLRNAIEATPSGGEVTVRGSVGNERAITIVADTGPGVDSTIVEHIFDPFFSGRSAGRGRGMGLSTAWRLAQQQGGDVRYLPPTNGPTQFVFTLPCTAAQPNSERRSA